MVVHESASSEGWFNNVVQWVITSATNQKRHFIQTTMNTVKFRLVNVWFISCNQHRRALFDDQIAHHLYVFQHLKTSESVGLERQTTIRMALSLFTGLRAAFVTTEDCVMCPTTVETEKDSCRLGDSDFKGHEKGHC